MSFPPEDIKKYDVFPGDGKDERSVREEIAPGYRRKLQVLIDRGLIDPVSLRRGMDFECGKGTITIAALPLFPNIHIFGVDIDAESGYSLLNEEEVRKATFVHDAVQRFILISAQESFDIVLAGEVRVPPYDFDYQSFANIIRPHGLVVELEPSLGYGPDFSFPEMERVGFTLLLRALPADFSWINNVNLWSRIG